LPLDFRSEASSPRNAPNRIPGLDGLRAISIILVLICHSRGLQPPPDSIVLKGKFGVYIFFVLSGYLITWILLEEENAKGSINPRAFYARRALRILPPALFYLACISILGLGGMLAIRPWDVVPCIFFFRNLTMGAVVTGHFWSLAIEEQFYLLWPLTLFLMRRPRTRLLVAVALILAAPFWRQFNYRLAGGAMFVNGDRFDLSYDALLIGCALALVRFKGVRFLQSPFVPLVSLLAIVAILSGATDIKVVRAFNTTASYLAVALIINYIVERRSGPLGAALNYRWVVWLGLISYSLYIWQHLFFAVCPNWWTAIPLAIGAASFSYWQIEMPFNLLRNRLR
jgi:peptidoglycan/LPS O-acetylase OafA/YrhL